MGVVAHGSGGRLSFRWLPTRVAPPQVNADGNLDELESDADAASFQIHHYCNQSDDECLS